MGLRAVDFAVPLILNLIHCAYTSEHILSCNVTALEPCPGQHQICNQTSSECMCDVGYVRVGDDCETPGPVPAANHAAAAAIVTIFTLALVIGGLILVVRKYSLLEYIQQKINLRRNNDVMYEDVMIGQDDPPLSP